MERRDRVMSIMFRTRISESAFQAQAIAVDLRAIRG